MNEQYSNEELRELRNDIRSLDRWFVRIDEKLNGLDRIEKRAEEAYTLADKADDKAHAVEVLTQVNARDIAGIETRFKWAVAAITPFILLILGKLFV